MLRERTYGMSAASKVSDFPAAYTLMKPLKLALPGVAVLYLVFLYAVVPSQNGGATVLAWFDGYEQPKFVLPAMLFTAPLLLLLMLSQVLSLGRVVPPSSLMNLFAASFTTTLINLPSLPSLIYHSYSCLSARLYSQPSPQFPASPFTFAHASFFAANLVFFVTKLAAKLSDDETGDKLWMSIGNIFAILGLYNLAFFLVPVTRIPLLQSLGVPVEHSIAYHRLAGNTAIGQFAIHALTHFVRFLLSKTDNSPSALAWLVWPRVFCTDTGFTCDDCTCYDLNKNVVGAYSLLAFAALALLSTPRHRRENYAKFYRNHVLLAPLALSLAVLHWSKMVAYLAPPILVYVVAYSIVKARFVQVERVEVAGRYSIITLATIKALPGSWCRIALPRPLSLTSLSAVKRGYELLTTPSHPYTLLHNPTRIVVKHSRTEFSKALQTLKPAGTLTFFPPVPPCSCHAVLLSGLETVTLVAGGVGITAFVSILLESGSANATLVWSCRSEKLVSKLMPELRKISALGVRVTVHQTAGDDTDESLALVSEDANSDDVVATGVTAEGFRTTARAQPTLLEKCAAAVVAFWLVIGCTVSYFTFLTMPDSSGNHSVGQRLAYLAWFAAVAVVTVGSGWGLRRNAAKLEQGEGIGLAGDLELAELAVNVGFDVGSNAKVEGEEEEEEEEGEKATGGAVSVIQGRPDLASLRGEKCIVCGPESMMQQLRGVNCWEEVFEW